MKPAIWANLHSHLIIIVAGYYLAASLLAFLIVGHDKRAAVSGRRRTAEQRLHLLSMVGGWPGTWLACQVFRHKTQKLSFQRRLGIMIALNFMLLAGMLILVHQYMEAG
jgi:uncharacterized membrane protein YsdA (DUF1294 family)